MSDYSDEWHDARKEANRRSAGVIVPYLQGLFDPSSVVDLGCGAGVWLEAFGLDDVLGVDVRRPMPCSVPRDRFVEHDLAAGFFTDRTFDLALSIETGEHLPEASAEGLVGSLVRLAPVVVFSAAVPYQPGTGHVNGQWPSWWATKFQERGYAPVDCLRLRHWDHPDVRYYHAQNLVVYVRRDQLENYGLEETPVPRLVHPRLYEYWVASFPPVELARWRGAARFAARVLHLSK